MTGSFVVRFYTLTPDQREWRGQIEHVQSGERSVFLGSQQLLEVLEKFSYQGQLKTGLRPTPKPPEDS